ncbi:MAG: hypothetical protein EAZ37_16845, partial [Burkholderiales bacterium]
AAPLLVKVTVALTVVPATPEPGNWMVVLTSARLAVKVAVTVAVLVPSVVDNEPAGKVFVPEAKLVTTAETEHEAPGGMTVPDETLNDPAPGVAVTVELAHVVAANGAAELLIFAGYESTKAAVNVAETSWCVLVNVITKRVVPPALIVLGVNDLEIVGRLGVMGSESAAVHVPPVQPAPVFVTPEGTEMKAVLVI